MNSGTVGFVAWTGLGAFFLWFEPGEQVCGLLRNAAYWGVWLYLFDKARW